MIESKNYRTFFKIGSKKKFISEANNNSKEKKHERML